MVCVCCFSLFFSLSLSLLTQSDGGNAGNRVPVLMYACDAVFIVDILADFRRPVLDRRKGVRERERETRHSREVIYVNLGVDMCEKEEEEEEEEECFPPYKIVHQTKTYTLILKMYLQHMNMLRKPNNQGDDCEALLHRQALPSLPQRKLLDEPCCFFTTGAVHTCHHT
jgi:hypothetical protein